MNRRTFLKLSALSAATAATGATSTKPEHALSEEVRRSHGADVVWNKAPCRFCGTGCHVQVGVKEGRVVSIAGDQKAAVNKGLLCVKGYHVGARPVWPEIA